MITPTILKQLELEKDFEIQIGDITYRVKFDKDHTETEDCFGHHNSSIQLIYLQPGIHISKKRNAFIHEVIHGMFWTSGLTYEDEFDKWEEKLCRALGEHINLFLLNNK